MSQVACETSDDESGRPDPEQTLPDYAPESFWLSKDAELDWLDENAFFHRKDSTKNSSHLLNPNNPNPNNPSHNPNHNPNSGSIGSQRYSGLNLKSKPSIIGLPKPQKPNYSVGRPASIRLFPKRSGSTGGRGPAVSEPSSPKVSCMGRVRSRKGSSRRGKNRKKTVEPGLVRVRSVKVRTDRIKETKVGFWSSFRLIFRSKGHKTGCKADGIHEAAIEPVSRTGSRSERKRGFVADVAGPSESGFSAEPPGLGGVKRFASGRRSDAWAGEVELDNGVKSEPLDRLGSIWDRRDRGPQKEVIVGRDWNAVGPASV